MTEHGAKPTLAETGRHDETEIEVTPAMIEAGVGAYDAAIECSADFEIVRLVYIAMLEASKKAHTHGP